MKELFMRFWSKEAYAVRILRALFVGVGLAVTSGELPWPTWVGVLLGLVGAAITGDASKAGITPGKKP